MATAGAIHQLVTRYVADERVPGLGYAITDADRILEEGVVGVRDLASGARVDPDALFEIGSIGKAFTAIVVLQLADEGRLAVDDPVVRHLPWFRVPRTGARITIHDLLSHTAGITAGIDGTPEAAFQVHALRRLPPGSARGRHFHYSNVGYKALGLVIEAVDGRPYPAAVRARVLEPLGMAATAPAVTNAIRDRLAVGHQTVPDDRIPHPGLPQIAVPWLETDTADGSIASTAGDMAAFARLLIRGGRAGVLSPTAFQQMTTPHSAGPLGYGYGLMARAMHDRRWLGHGGGMVGYLAGLQIDQDAGVGAVVLQNGMSGNPVALARRLVLAATGDEPAARQPPPAGAPPLAGMYVRLDGEGPGPDAFEIVLHDDAAHVRVAGREARLDAYGEGAWLAPDDALDHHLLAGGQAGEPWLWHGGARYAIAGTMPRALPEPEPRLRAYVGQYRSHNPWTTNFRVVLRGDRLWLTFAAAPDGFDDEQPLFERRDGSFRVGTDRLGPERVRFDTLVAGRALRAWLSGWDYYRTS